MVPSHAPVGTVDRPVLLAIDGRLRTADYVDRTAIGHKRGKPTLTAWFDVSYFPTKVSEAYYDVRWYTSDDFEIHYQENHANGDRWCRRWDRHPRNGSRDHYHPPPDADSPPEPASYPQNHYEVMRLVDGATIEHLDTHPLFSGD